MATPATLDGDVNVSGALTAGSFTPPAGSVTDAAIKAAAGISATKFFHRQAIPYWQADGSDVVSETQPVYTVRGATGTVQAIKVVPLTAPDGVGGSPRQYTVDVQKSTGAGAFATILSAAEVVDGTSVDRTPQDATISDSAVVADDILQVVITTSGSTGAQGQGLLVDIFLDEDPT